MSHFDQLKLIDMLYDSIAYDKESEKKNVFQYMEYLIDKIYGVEKSILNQHGPSTQ